MEQRSLPYHGQQLKGKDDDNDEGCAKYYY